MANGTQGRSDKRLPDLDTVFTINPDGSRNFIQLADVTGRWQRRKHLFWFLLILVYVALPLIRIGETGRPHRPPRAGRVALRRDVHEPGLLPALLRLHGPLVRPVRRDGALGARVVRIRVSADRVLGGRVPPRRAMDRRLPGSAAAPARAGRPRPRAPDDREARRISPPQHVRRARVRRLLHPGRGADPRPLPIPRRAHDGVHVDERVDARPVWQLRVVPRADVSDPLSLRTAPGRARGFGHGRHRL